MGMGYIMFKAESVEAGTVFRIQGLTITRCWRPLMKPDKVCSSCLPAMSKNLGRIIAWVGDESDKSSINIDIKLREIIQEQMALILSANQARRTKKVMRKT